MSIRTILVVALLGLSCGCTTMQETGHKIGEFSRNLVDAITRAPRKAAVKTTDQYFPDERREGINELVDRSFGQRPPYTAQYANLAQTDPDYLVRATAVRALNRARDQAAIPVFIVALNDVSDMVRLEGAKALINLPDEKAIPALVKLVTNANENRDVRIAAAEALKHYRNADACRALVGQLSGRDFGLAWQSRRSLVRMTGQDMRYDEVAWLTYLANPDQPLS